LDLPLPVLQNERMTWGQTEWLWAIALVVSVLASYAITKKFGNRRRKVLFTWNSVQLMPERNRTNGRGMSGALQVSFLGKAVEDPYLVQVTLKNIGPVDIASSDFDAGRQLKVSFPGEYLEVVDWKQVGFDAPFGQDYRYVTLDPVLLRRGASFTLDVLVDGKPEVELDCPLINTDIVHVDTRARTVEALNQSKDPLDFIVKFLVSTVTNSRS